MANDINLAALWIPVMPETSKLAPEMQKAGEAGKKAFLQGFSGGGASPEQLGQQFAQQFSKSFSSTFEGLPMPETMKKIMESVGSETKTTEAQLVKLKNTAASTFEAYSKAAQSAAHYQGELTRLTEAYNKSVSEGKPVAFLHEQAVKAEELHRQSLTTLTQTQRQYTEATTRLSAAQGESARASQLMTAVVGGLAGAFATLGIEAVTKGFELLVEGMHKAVEVGEEVVKFTVEAGEKFEGIAHQITLFSDASGEAFEKLEGSAAKVFGELDVKGDDLGKTMAILSKSLGLEAGPALEQLTRHVEELEGRFGKLDISALAASFFQFGISGEDADRHLASILQSSREAGVSFADVAAGMKTLGPTAIELGMSYDQAGKFLADMTQRGETAVTVVTAMEHAQDTFTKKGLSFKDGMAEAAKEIQNLVDSGDKVNADALAQKLFGRRWNEALEMIRDFQDTMAATPESLAGTSSGIDDVVDSTQKLSDKWENLKHQAETVLAPLGTLILEKLGGAIENVSNVFRDKHDEIVAKVRDIGHSFIDMLPDIKDFVETSLRLFGALANPLKEMLVLTVQTALGVADVYAMITGNDKLHDSIAKSAESLDKLEKLDIGKMFGDAADKVHDFDINTQGLNSSLDDLIDKQHESSQIPAPNVPFGPGLPNPPSITLPPPGAPGAKLPSGTPPTQGPIPVAPKPGPPGSPTDIFGPQGALGAPGTAMPPSIVGPQNPLTPPSVAGQGFGNYGAISAYLDSKNVDSIKNYARQVFPWADSEWSAFVWLVEHESGWSTTATSSMGAKGIGQFMPQTFANYGYPGGTTDAATQLALMFEYIYNRYGTPSAAVAQYYNHPRGEGSYAAGGSIKGDMGSILMALLGGSRGTDTVPIWATPGETMMNVGASQMFGPMLKFMNAKGLQGGGGTGSSDYAASGAGNDIAGVDPQIVAMTAIANQMGLTLTAGKSGHGTHDIDQGYHDTGEAGDFSDGYQTEGEYQFALFVMQHYGSQLAEVIHDDPRLPQLIKDGRAVDKSFYGADTLAGHRDHVHVAVRATQALTDQLTPGSQPLVPGSPGTSMNMSYNPAGNVAPGSKGQFPGMPGQYGGYGAYGAETYDEVARNDKAVRDAQQRASDMDTAITQKQADITRLQGEVDKIKAQPGLLQDDEKLASSTRQLADAQTDLARLQRERTDQDSTIADAQRKQLEDYYKAPSGAPKDRRRTATGVEAFEDLGSGLMKGIADELGLGDIFAKPPWEWGIFKLAAGLTNWGIGTANAWANEVGKGHTGMTGFQPIPGWDTESGSGGGLNLGGISLPNVANLVNPNVSAGPNISATNTIPSPGYGQPYGPAPGPVNSNNLIVNQSGMNMSDVQGMKVADNARNNVVVNNAGMPQTGA